MSQNLPDHSVNKTSAIRRSDSTIVLSLALSPLEVPELVGMILGDLANGELVSAARVCRTWSEPAFDRLWRTMRSLVPLFSLIGPMDRDLRGEWAFTDDIKNSDWSRYSVYAHRIREVTIWDYDPETRVSVQAMRTVLAYLPSHLQLPLPSAIHLTTMAPVPATVLELPLISQSLRKLSLSKLQYGYQTGYTSQTGHPSQSLVALLQGLIQAASRPHDPCLEELMVSCCTSSAALIEAFDACLIKHRSHIARLTAKFPFDGRVWDSIFSLPILQTLAIAPLNVDTSTPGTSVDLFPMMQTLVERQPLLKELRLELGFALHGDPSNLSYSRIIRILMGLRSLESLVLNISLPLHLSESEVREMGTSWPKMRILELSTICYWTGNISILEVGPQTDLSLLPCFIRWLPRLEELNVSFVCNNPLIAPQQQLPASALHTLGLGTSPTPVASQEEVVEYLAAVLPRHAHLRHWNIYGGRFWDGVARDLDSLWKATQQT